MFGALKGEGDINFGHDTVDRQNPGGAPGDRI